jgi:hypothetical protein
VKLQTKLEAIIYKALTNLLLAAAKKVVLDAVIDRSGDNYSGSSIDDASLKVLANKRIYDEVYKLAYGSPIADKQCVLFS